MSFVGSGDIPSAIERTGYISRPILSSDEARSLARRVDDNSTLLTNIGSGALLYALGRPSYVFGGDEDGVQNNNEAILTAFGFPFFELVFERLFLEFGLKVRLSARLKYPGVHVFKSDHSLVYLGGGYHSDNFSEKYPTYHRSLRAEYLLSLTLPLALPISGSGIQFAINQPDEAETPVIAASFIPYRIGEAVLFPSSWKHRIAPSYISGWRDQRITFQSHLVASRDGYVCFW